MSVGKCADPPPGRDTTRSLSRPAGPPAQCRHFRIRRFAHLTHLSCCMLPPAIFLLTDSISNQSSSSAQHGGRRGTSDIGRGHAHFAVKRWLSISLEWDLKTLQISLKLTPMHPISASCWTACLLKRGPPWESRIQSTRYLRHALGELLSWPRPPLRKNPWP